MASRVLTVVLLVGLCSGSLALVPRLKGCHLPGNQQGYEPVQPIAFSHRMHAGELKIACLYCHFGAEKSRHAGVPAASMCMNCHRLVNAAWDVTFQQYVEGLKNNTAPQRIISPELQKLYDSLGLDSQLQPDPKKQTTPIAWVKVHDLPDYACFDHRAHATAGVECQRCHGPVESMDRIRQVQDLSMAWCIECHRNPGQTGPAGKPLRPSTDCAVCHY